MPLNTPGVPASVIYLAIKSRASSCQIKNRYKKGPHRINRRAALMIQSTLFTGSNIALCTFTGRVLADPAGINDNIDVALGDRQWFQQDGIHFNATLAV